MMMNRLQRNDEPHRPVSIGSIGSIASICKPRLTSRDE
jgi:hypothetical protein